MERLTAEERTKMLEQRINDLSNSMGVLITGWAVHLHQSHRRIKHMEKEIRNYEMQAMTYRTKGEDKKRERSWRGIESDTDRTVSEMSDISAIFEPENNRGNI